MKKLILFVSFLFITSLCFGQNLALNPGFENWTINGAGGPPDDWSLSSGSMTATQESTTIHGGTYSANVTWTTTSTVYLQQFIAVTAGTNYQFTFWVYDNDQYGRARCYIRWYDSEGSMVTPSYGGSYTTDSDVWQQLDSGMQEAPATAVSAHIEIRVYDVSWTGVGTATVYVDDVSFTAATGNSINYAYAISLDELEVFYLNDVTSVNASDFELTGTATITFNTATIDGTNAKLVHLSGASNPMADDNTLDTISDDAKSTYDFYAGITSIAYTNAANPSGTIDGSHFATFTGIISANDGHNNVWISDADGQFNGVLIYDYDFDGLVSVGDEIIFRAYRDVYDNLSELKYPELINTISTGNSPYGPSVIPGSSIDITYGADNPTAEPWEGQLVMIEDVVVSTIVKDDLYYGSDDGGTTSFVIGDAVDYNYSATGALLDSAVASGNPYDIIGVVDWSTDDPYYRINPRDADDIISTISIDPTPGNEFVLQNYPNPSTGSTTISFSLPHNATGEINIYNIHGQLVRTLTPEDQSAIWNGQDESGRVVANGIYFYTLDTGKEILTKKMILMK